MNDVANQINESMRNVFRATEWLNAYNASVTGTTGGKFAISALRERRNNLGRYSKRALRVEGKKMRCGIKWIAMLEGLWGGYIG